MELEIVDVVLGYGCHLSPMVERYLQRTAELLRPRPVEKSLVITTGGRTAARTAPGVSEAGMMAEALRGLGVQSPMLLEERARTTVENLRNVAQLIAERGLAPRRLLIHGDRVRAQKIRALARHFLGDQPFEVAPQDLQRPLGHALVQSTVAVPFDALVARVAWLERLSLRVIERRIRRA